MNTSAKQAQAEMIQKVEKNTNSKAHFVTAEDLEDGIGVGFVAGYNFVINSGTDQAQWMRGDVAIKEAGLRFALFNKRGEEKTSYQSFFAMKSKADLLDFEGKEYSVKVLNA